MDCHTCSSHDGMEKQGDIRWSGEVFYFGARGIAGKERLEGERNVISRRWALDFYHALLSLCPQV